MADTTFVNGTVIQPDWLNDVNDYIYNFKSILEFGAVGDGVADDTAALNTAAAAGIPIYFPDGIYTTTTGIVFSNGTKFVGCGTWTATSRTNQTQGNSVIRYTGAGGTNSYIIRASVAAVGTTTSTNLNNVALMNIVLDGQFVAEFGLYGVRCLANNRFEYITVTRTVKHAFWFNICFNGTLINPMAYLNQGAGITMGKDTFGWGQFAFDQCTVISPFGYYNGANGDATSVSWYNQFNETTNPEAEYGIGFFGGRGTVFLNAQGAQNGGAGLYVSPALLIPVTFIGGYFEGDGQSNQTGVPGSATPSGTAWEIWVNSGAASNGIKFDSIHLGLTPAIRLTGTAPSRPSGGVKFENMPLLGNIKSDYRNYRLMDCDPTVTFTGGVKPTNFKSQYGTAKNIEIVGSAVFSAVGGSMSILNMEGNIANVVYTGVGTYTVTLDESFTSARYGVQLTTGANRVAGVSSVAVGSFVINNAQITAGAFAATDSGATITVWVSGFY